MKSKRRKKEGRVYICAKEICGKKKERKEKEKKKKKKRRR